MEITEQALNKLKIAGTIGGVVVLGLIGLSIYATYLSIKADKLTIANLTKG